MSFDVLPDVQNANRGHYEVVDRNIRALLDAGIRTMVNSTIIPSSVERIEEMVGTVADRYPGLAQYTVEPATGTDLFGTPEAMRRYYDAFLSNYFKAKDISLRRGVPLRFTFDDSLRGVTARHCPGKFALTPSGRISVCHLVSSPAEPRFGECVYGRVADGEVRIDRRRFDELYSAMSAPTPSAPTAWPNGAAAANASHAAPPTPPNSWPKYVASTELLLSDL